MPILLIKLISINNNINKIYEIKLIHYYNLQIDFTLDIILPVYNNVYIWKHTFNQIKIWNIVYKTGKENV